MKMVLVFLLLFQCHQESAQSNIISAFLNITVKHNLKKTVKLFCKVVKGVRKLFELH